MQCRRCFKQKTTDPGGPPQRPLLAKQGLPCLRLRPSHQRPVLQMHLFIFRECRVVHVALQAALALAAALPLPAGIPPALVRSVHRYPVKAS